MKNISQFFHCFSFSLRMGLYCLFCGLSNDLFPLFYSFANGLFGQFVVRSHIDIILFFLWNTYKYWCWRWTWFDVVLWLVKVWCEANRMSCNGVNGLLHTLKRNSFVRIKHSLVHCSIYRCIFFCIMVYYHFIVFVMLCEVMSHCRTSISLHSCWFLLLLTIRWQHKVAWDKVRQ